MTKVGFVGLGSMGLPMAKNLAAKGFAVTGFDLRAEAVKDLAGAGGKAAANVGDALADGHGEERARRDERHRTEPCGPEAEAEQHRTIAEGEVDITERLARPARLDRGQNQRHQHHGRHAEQRAGGR